MICLPFRRRKTPRRPEAEEEEEEEEEEETVAEMEVTQPGRAGCMRQPLGITVTTAMCMARDSLRGGQMGAGGCCSMCFAWRLRYGVEGVV
jgi:hypothetical protein